MSRQTFTAVDVSDFPPSSNSAVASTVSATNLWNPAIWTPIPALDMKPGKFWILECGGIISNTSTPTIIFHLRIGQSATPASNVDLGATVTYTTASGLSSTPWNGRFIVAVRSIGMAASGATLVGWGNIFIGGVSTTVSTVLALGDVVPTTVDHTAAQGVVVDVTWGTSSASNTITARGHVLRSGN